MSRSTTRVIACGVVALAAGATFAVPARAAEPAYTMEFAAGQACAGFALRVDAYGAGSQVVKTFTDREGNVVRILTAGTGYQAQYTNLTSGKVYSTMANGAVTDVVPTSDGGSQVTFLGHNVLFMFPSDVPAGPSTTLYTGRVTLNIDAMGNYTLLTVSGMSLDICAKVA